jgi:hypothetical protein
VEIQAHCGMIVCMLILIDMGEKPNRAMEQMGWDYLIGLASLKELEAFIKTRKESTPAQPRPRRHVGFAAARSSVERGSGLPIPARRRRGQAQARSRSADVSEQAKVRMTAARVRPRAVWAS